MFSNLIRNDSLVGIDSNLIFVVDSVIWALFLLLFRSNALLCTYVSLTARHKGFLKDCPDGLLTEAGFIKIYTQVF